MHVLAEVGIDAIRAHDVGLANRFRDGLEPSDSAMGFCDIEGAAARIERAGARAALYVLSG